MTSRTSFEDSHAAYEARILDRFLDADEPERPEYYEDERGLWHHYTGRFASEGEIKNWKRGQL